MRLRSILILLVVASAQLSLAQIRATTEGGNKVLLFEDGTWKYHENEIVEVISAEPDAAVAAATVATVAAIEIDNTKEVTTDPENIFFLPSPRLVKFFGEKGGNLRCKMSCSNNKGDVKVRFQFEAPVGDGARYFGWFKEGTLITFTMIDGQKVEMTMADEAEIKQMKKYNYSVLSNASVPLTESQLSILASQPFRKIEVGWKKKSEEYDLDRSNYLMETLPTVL